MVNFSLKVFISLNYAKGRIHNLGMNVFSDI